MSILIKDRKLVCTLEDANISVNESNSEDIKTNTLKIADSINTTTLNKMRSHLVDSSGSSLGITTGALNVKEANSTVMNTNIGLLSNSVDTFLVNKIRNQIVDGSGNSVSVTSNALNTNISSQTGTLNVLDTNSANINTNITTLSGVVKTRSDTYSGTNKGILSFGIRNDNLSNSLTGNNDAHSAISLDNNGAIYTNNYRLVGNTIATNSGVLSSGTQRICIATDDVNMSSLVKNINEKISWVKISESDIEKLYYDSTYQFLYTRRIISGSINEPLLNGNLATSLYTNGDTYQLYSRYWVPQFSIMRYDYITSMEPHTDTLYSMSFGLIRYISDVSETGNDRSIIIKLFYANSARRISITFNNQSTDIVYDNNTLNNFTNSSNLPSNIFNFNRWSIIMYNNVIEFYVFNGMEMKLFHTHSYLQNYNLSTNGGFLVAPSFVQYGKITCTSSTSYTGNNVLKFCAYTHKDVIPTELSFLKVLSSNLFTKNTASTSELPMICFTYREFSNFNYDLYYPIYMELFLYSKTYDSTIKIYYYRSTNAALTSESFFMGNFRYSLSAPSTTDPIIVLDNFYLKSTTEKIARLNNCFLYLGPNFTSTDFPLIYITTQCSNVSSNDLLFNIKFYCI